MRLLGVQIGGSLHIPLDQGISSDQYIHELYSAAAGAEGLIDSANTTAIYNSSEDVYGSGVVRTNRLYESSTPITSLQVDEILEYAQPAVKGTFNVSFDDGASWSTATNYLDGSSVTSFTGTTTDDDTKYRLRLKLNLGAGYSQAPEHTWAVTSSLNTGRAGSGGCGTTSAALAIGGKTSTTKIDTTEIWNGSIWSTTSSLTEAKDQVRGCGTTSAALGVRGRLIGDSYGAVSEIWSGSIWATTTNTVIDRGEGSSSCGTTSDALCFGGYNGVIQDSTEIWNGSTWVTTTSLPKARDAIGGCGTTSAALCVSGYDASWTIISDTEIWNGDFWVTTTSIVATPGQAMGACGTTSNALRIGGYNSGVLDDTEIWNGSIWVTTNSLIIAQSHVGEAGDVSDAIVFGTIGNLPTTELWAERYPIRSGGTWVTTSSLNVARHGSAGCGTTSDTLIFGGYDISASTEIWNGSTWATTGNLLTSGATNNYFLAGCGITSDALAYGGATDASIDITEIWSGSSWATTTSLIATVNGHGGCGTISAALSCGGAGKDTTEIWNGSIWATTSATLSSARQGIDAVGTTSNALTAGGYTDAPVNTTEIWSGSSWATTTVLPVVRYYCGTVGTTSDALIFGGSSGATVDTTNIWNGSTWATTTTLTAVTAQCTGCGTVSDALCSGNSTKTEKWGGTGLQKGFACKIN
jgi:hypothetical protein